MCVMSMVHDHYDPIIPWVPQPVRTPLTPPPNTPIFVPQNGPGLIEQLAELTKLIADFRAAVDAARVVDTLTAQPDCVDPAKAKLEERVLRLEKEIDRLKRAKRAKPKRKR